jgi:hypothetical protein
MICDSLYQRTRLTFRKLRRLASGDGMPKILHPLSFWAFLVVVALKRWDLDPSRNQQKMKKAARQFTFLALFG